MPNLIEVQKSSAMTLFLGSGDQPAPMDGEGIIGVFQSVFPIKDFNETAVLEFVKYELEPPKYDVEECQQRDMTYAAPLKVTLRLIVFEVDEDTGAKSVKDIKEQDVFMGDMPLMTDNGTFFVNGTERVIVPRCTARLACSLTTTRARRTHPASFCLPRALSLTVAPGWISSSTPRTCLSSASTVAASCRSRPCCMRLGLDQEAICDPILRHALNTRRKDGWSAFLRVERCAAPSRL